MGDFESQSEKGDRPPSQLTPLSDALAAVQRIFEKFGDSSVIIGGVAAGLLGKPRLTSDIDVLLLIDQEKLPDLLAATKLENFVPRIDDALGFAAMYRVLLLRNDHVNVDLDISLGALPFEIEAVERSRVHRVGKLSLRLPTSEDFIIMKAVAHRPQDMIDIRHVIERHPSLDRERVEIWVREFAQLMEMPEMWDDVQAMFEAETL